MKFDDFALAIGYLTIGFWIIAVLVYIFTVMTITKKIGALTGSESMSVRGGCRRADGKPCRTA